MKNKRTINIIAQQLKSMADTANNLLAILQEPEETDEPTIVLAPNDTEKYVYGLKGIADLFHVSKVTASIYKSTWLAPAVNQRGMVIMTDKKKALELFAEHKEE